MAGDGCYSRHGKRDEISDQRFYETNQSGEPFTGVLSPSEVKAVGEEATFTSGDQSGGGRIGPGGGERRSEGGDQVGAEAVLAGAGQGKDQHTTPLFESTHDIEVLVILKEKWVFILLVGSRKKKNNYLERFFFSFNRFVLQFQLHLLALLVSAEAWSWKKSVYIWMDLVCTRSFH
jgi:hypothetical protein